MFRRFQAWLRQKVGYKTPQEKDWLESYNKQPAPVKDDLIDLNNTRT